MSAVNNKSEERNVCRHWLGAELHWGGPRVTAHPGHSTLLCSYTNNFQPGEPETSFPTSCPASVTVFCPFFFVPAPAPILIIVILFVVCPQFQVTVLWDTSPLWARPPRNTISPPLQRGTDTDTLHGIGHDWSHLKCVLISGAILARWVLSSVPLSNLHLSTLVNKNLYFATPSDFSNKRTLGSSNYCFSHSIKMSTKYN